MSKSSKKTTTSSNKLDPALQQKFDTNYQQAQTVANRPYEPYTGTLVAPFNQNQQTGFSMFADVANTNPGGATLADATSAARQASMFSPTQVTGGFNPTPITTGYQAPQVGAPSPITATPITASHTPSMFTATNVNSNYSPTMMGPAAPARTVAQARDVTASPVAAGMFTDLDMSKYMNPYTNEVVNRTQADLERQRQMAMARSGGEISGANAFGGSRHGVADALTNEAYARTSGDVLAALRASGYDRAADLGTQDLNRKLSADTTTAGLQLAAGQSNQQADTTRNLATQQGAIRADELGFSREAANQSAGLEGARINQNAQIANQAAQLQAQGMTADDAFRAASMMFNTQSTNAANNLTAQTTNAQLTQNADLANIQARLATMGMNIDAERFNSDQAYRAAVMQMDAQIQNQQAGIQGAGINLAGAGTLAGLAGQERNTALGNASLFSAMGDQQQAQAQAEAQAQYEQFLRQWMYPQEQQSIRNTSVGLLPITGTTTGVEKSTPGLFDYLSLAANTATAFA